MSDGMGREFTYLSSHATNRYIIPNWGNNTTLANAKGSPLVFITLPVIFCAIICVIVERHNAVVKITFSFILLLFACFIYFSAAKV